MNPRYSIPAVVLFALAASASAFAQGTPAPGQNSPEPRWYIAAIGGATSRPPAAPVFGVEIAEHLGRHAQAYATISYFENLMRDTLRDDLDFTATRLATLTGEDWSLSGRDRRRTERRRARMRRRRVRRRDRRDKLQQSGHHPVEHGPDRQARVGKNRAGLHL